MWLISQSHAKMFYIPGNCHWGSSGSFKHGFCPVALLVRVNSCALKVHRQLRYSCTVQLGWDASHMLMSATFASRSISLMFHPAYILHTLLANQLMRSPRHSLPPLSVQKAGKDAGLESFPQRSYLTLLLNIDNVASFIRNVEEWALQKLSCCN